MSSKPNLVEGCYLVSRMLFSIFGYHITHVGNVNGIIQKNAILIQNLKNNWIVFYTNTINKLLWRLDMLWLVYSENESCYTVKR